MESDREFVKRMNGWFHKTRLTSTLPVQPDDFARLLALALRGAETQWRPIEEAPPSCDKIVYQPAHKAGQLILSPRVCFDRNSGARESTHFIPLTALGEPK